MTGHTGDGHQLARSLLAGSRRIVTFSGAGLSAESGVPTFRDRPDGLWAQFNPAQLASPEGFAQDPDLVIEWYAWRRRMVARAAPNPAHAALARRTDLVHVTQNVDDLLERAGAVPDTVIHVHGRIEVDRCHGGCGFEQRIDLADPPPLRRCPSCGAPVRPAVVWFGEAVPPEAITAAAGACIECDALLVIGTSAVVHPAAGLIGVAREHGAAIILVNTEASAASAAADLELLGPAGAIVPALLWD